MRELTNYGKDRKYIDLHEGYYFYVKTTEDFVSLSINELCVIVDHHRKTTEEKAAEPDLISPEQILELEFLTKRITDYTDRLKSFTRKLINKQ